MSTTGATGYAQINGNITINWGQVNLSTTTQTLTFAKSYVDANPAIVFGWTGLSGANTTCIGPQVQSVSKTGFQFAVGAIGGSGVTVAWWMAIGT